MTPWANMLVVEEGCRPRVSFQNWMSEGTKPDSQEMRTSSGSQLASFVFCVHEACVPTQGPRDCWSKVCKGE